ncbi:MAG: site-specific DNA-methyltransferase [Bacteroidales bacterium]
MQNLIQGDCLVEMQNIPSKSVDMILCDLPYGTTACPWDTTLSFEKLWEQYERIIKDDGAIVLFSTQPFTSKLVCSNLPLFKYNWVWDKGKVGGFTSAKLKPLKLFEDICVFSKGKTANCNKFNMRYYPQGLIKVDKISRSSTDTSKTGYSRPSQTKFYKQEFTNYPKQLLKFNLDKKRIHPTQKPVELCEYLIKTYTNEGDTVLDNCMGSGSTGVACKNTNRNFIGIELDETYFEIAKQRIM